MEKNLSSEEAWSGSGYCGISYWKAFERTSGENPMTCICDLVQQGRCGRWRRLPFHQNQCGRRHAVISVTQFLTLSQMELPRPGGFLSGVTLVTQDHFYSIIGVARAAFWFRLLGWLWPCSPGPCGHHGRVTEDIFMSRNACKKSNENTIKHNQVLSAGLSVYWGPAKVGKKRNRDNPGHLGRRFMQLIQNISWNIFWRKKLWILI